MYGTELKKECCRCGKRQLNDGSEMTFSTFYIYKNEYVYCEICARKKLCSNFHIVNTDFKIMY